MKGGVEYESAWGMSFLDRERTIKHINKHHKEMDPNGKDYF